MTEISRNAFLEEAMVNNAKQKIGEIPPASPSYYASNRKYQPLDVIEDWQLGFNLGNVIKYIARAGRKHQPNQSILESKFEDLQKAKYYIDRELKILSK